MLKIDASFIVLIMNHGDSLINVIMIFTICCCCVILVITVLQIPYYFAIETIQKFTVKFIYLTDKSLINESFNKCVEFQTFLTNYGNSSDNF